MADRDSSVTPSTEMSVQETTDLLSELKEERLMEKQDAREDAYENQI